MNIESIEIEEEGDYVVATYKGFPLLGGAGNSRQEAIINLKQIYELLGKLTDVVDMEQLNNQWEESLKAECVETECAQPFEDSFEAGTSFEDLSDEEVEYKLEVLTQIGDVFSSTEELLDVDISLMGTHYSPQQYLDGINDILTQLDRIYQKLS